MADAATTDRPAVEQDLVRRIAPLEQEAASLQEELSSARMKKWIVVGAFVLFVCVTSFSYAGIWYRIQDKKNVDKLLELAQKRLEQHSDRYMKEVQVLVDHSAPVLSEAFAAQAKKDLPAYLEAVGRERDILVSSLQTELELRLKKHHHTLLTRNEKLFVEEFPDVANEDLHDRMVGNLEIAAQNVAKKHCIDQLEKQINQLYASWDQFPAEETADKSEEALAEQLLGTIAELLTLRLTQPMTHDN